MYRRIITFRIWCQLLDRRQQRLDLVLVSVDSFALEEDKNHLNLSPHGLPPVNVNLIFSEETDIWINVHDILHFFPSEDKSKMTFLWASEESGFRHLYQITVALTAQLTNCVDEAIPSDGEILKKFDRILIIIFSFKLQVCKRRKSLKELH
jgi:dipeptidyl-peptidase 9